MRASSRKKKMYIEGAWTGVDSILASFCMRACLDTAFRLAPIKYIINNWSILGTQYYYHRSRPRYPESNISFALSHVPYLLGAENLMQLAPRFVSGP